MARLSKSKTAWPREKAFEWVKLHKMVAIIRTRNSVQAKNTIEALVKGGFKLFEVAMTVIGATDIIREYSTKSGLLVGAGSVLSEKAAQNALTAGARFLMTPHTDPAILKLARRSKTLYMAGALTPNEVVRAWTAGADVVRVFPVRAVGGAAYIKALKELFADIPLMPSGGITLENTQDYFLSGSTAVGAAGALMSENTMDNSRWGDITAQARRFQDVIQRL